MLVAGLVAFGVVVSVLSLSLPFGMAYLTYTDASVRSSDHPAFWALVSLFVPVVGAVGYRAVRTRLGDPTRGVPRRARWVRKWVRVVAGGLATLFVGLLTWSVVFGGLSIPATALWSMGSLPVGLGLVFWLVPTWPDDTVRSPARDGTEPSSPSLSWRVVAGLVVGTVAAVVLGGWSVFLAAPLDSVLLQLFVGVVCLLAGGVVVGVVFRPYLPRVFPDARPADEPLGSEYADRCRAFGCPVEGVWVASNLKGNAGLAEIAGVLPGKRHLFLDEQAFETYDDRERLAVVAQQVALADSYYWLYGKLVAYLAILAYYGLVALAIEWNGGASPFPDWPLVPEVVLVAFLVGGVVHGRRKVYRADRFAADRTSVETVVTALESLDARNAESDEERSRAWLLSTFWTRPSPEKRIERLRNSR